MTDYVLFLMALASSAVALAWLMFAAARHRAALAGVPVRIHVAGTRGKSTTTRLIAAGLRAGGLRVVAKTTGSEARLIRPDGGEEPWPRWGVASIREQMRLVRYAARIGADALVVECMAIHPEMVWASERHMVQATTAVLTNARPDHFEDVGPDPHAMAAALRWVTPKAGRLIVAAEAADADLRAWAARRGTELTVVDTAGLEPLAEDRALALAVCEAHGVQPDIAGQAMALAAGDPGVFFDRTLTVGGKTVRFANAFACNDVDSFARLWAEVPAPPPAVVILNARPDRPVRSRSFVEFLAARQPAPVIFVTGDAYALNFARRLTRGVVRRLKDRTPGGALAELAAAAPEGGVIWGVGNYHGFGAAMVGALTEADPRLLTGALVIGVAVSLLLTEWTGLTAGGIIVPGYVALLLDRPGALLGFVLVAFASYGIILLLATRLMLYGTRRFAVAVLVGMTLSLGAQWIRPLFDLPFVEWVGLGYIVPGLVAHQFDRQGVWQTLVMLAIAAPIVRLIIWLWVHV